MDPRSTLDTPAGYSFGPFLLDPVRRLLWRDGRLVTLTSRTFDILLLLLEHRGEIVEKDHLLSAIWGQTIVEEATVVRHVSSLRKALHLIPNEHDVLVTIPGRGYRFVADVEALQTLPPGLPVAAAAEPSLSGTAVHDSVAPAAVADPSRVPWGRSRPLAAAAVCVVLVFAVWVAVRSDSPAPQRTRDFRQITYDVGAPRDPSWSPDGTRIAFTSDHDGNPDIWLQGLDDPAPTRLTSSDEADSQPDWSPDGSSIVFRSERQGGGLYLISTTGRSERRLTAFGFRPRWSPDGRRILFLSTSLRGPHLYITDREGSSPREVLASVTADFTNFTSEWHPDGLRISIWGRRRGAGWAFATAPVDGGPVQYATFSAQAQDWLDSNRVTLSRFVWSRAAGYLYFEGASDHLRNLWRVEIDERSSWIGAPERLTTTSAGQDRDAVLSADGRHLAFVSRTDQTRLWSFPLAQSGAVAGEGQPITSGDGSDLQAALASHGDRMVYQSVRRGGYSELRSLSLLDHREHVLTSGTDQIEHVIWSHDGNRVGYWTQRRGNNVERNSGSHSEFVVLNPAGGTETQYALTGTQSDFLPFDWASDGRTILGTCGRPGAVCSVDLTAPDRSPVIVASDPRFSLFQAHFSPDARWIVFFAQDMKEGGRSRLYVVPASGGTWIPITDGQAFDDKPRWSSDGRLLYYLSTRGAFLNIWARRFEPLAGAPVGEPFRVTSFASGRRMISPDRINRMEIDVASDRLTLPVTESSSQIWVLDGVDR
ncbi:MAG: winged helix-turn-helix domain-containing protein [Vicinamibacterales bacterium]